MNKNGRIISKTSVSIFLIINCIILMEFSIMPVLAYYDPQAELTTEVLLNKEGVIYDLSPLEKYVEDGSVNVKEISENPHNNQSEWPPGTYYLYRSHFNRDLGVVINEVNLSTFVGLSVNLVIPTKWDENKQTYVLYVSLDPKKLNWSAAMSTELKWLINQSIITGLTELEIQQITRLVYDGSRVIYENGTWVTAPRGKDTFDVKMPFNLEDFPDDVPGRKRRIPKEGVPIIVIMGAVVALIACGTFSYTRLKRRSILDNLNRKNIFEHIKANSGIHFKKLLRELNFKPGALSYHLNILEKGEYIKSIQHGNMRKFYLYGTKSDLKLVLTTIQLRILSVVDERPGISQSNISKTIGKTRMLVNYHIKIFADANILSIEKSGRESLCYTTSSATPYLPG